MSQLAYALENQPQIQQQAVYLCQQQDLVPFSGVAARFGRHAIALFYLPGQQVELYGVSHLDPATGAPVMAHGLLGESGGEFYIAAPLHKQHRNNAEHHYDQRGQRDADRQELPHRRRVREAGRGTDRCCIARFIRSPSSEPGPAGSTSRHARGWFCKNIYFFQYKNQE